MHTDINLSHFKVQSKCQGYEDRSVVNEFANKTYVDQVAQALTQPSCRATANLSRLIQML